MGFSYEFEYALGNELDGIGFVLYLIYVLFSIGIAVALYAMRAMSLYSIAERRGIRKPWLAWLPVGDMWILGCISDQYRYVTKGQVKNKRKILLVLSLLVFAALVAVLVLVVSLVTTMTGIPEEIQDSVLMGQMLGTVLGLLLLYLVLWGVAVAVIVLQFMALYDLYASCDPENKVLYLLLNIFFVVTMPIFLLVCRKKDLGMPPRTQPMEPVETIPEPWVDPEE